MALKARLLKDVVCPGSDGKDQVLGRAGEIVELTPTFHFSLAGAKLCYGENNSIQLAEGADYESV